jgi:hypothetical protein
MMDRSTAVFLAAATVVALAATLLLNYGFFSLACTHHDWATFGRWLLRAGCR